MMHNNPGVNKDIKMWYSRIFMAAAITIWNGRLEFGFMEPYYTWSANYYHESIAPEFWHIFRIYDGGKYKEFFFLIFTK